MERYRPSQNSSEATQDPVDIKAAKFSKKLDKIQIAGGALLTPFFPALGIAIIAWNGGQHYLTDRYINWRNKKRARQTFPQAA